LIPEWHKGIAEISEEMIIVSEYSYRYLGLSMFNHFGWSNFTIEEVESLIFWISQTIIVRIAWSESSKMLLPTQLLCYVVANVPFNAQI